MARHLPKVARRVRRADRLPSLPMDDSGATGAIRFLVGLGNPGERYERTRHNVGFLVLDRLAGTTNWQRCGLWMESDVTVGGEPIRLVKPLTYMNRSGEALAELFQRANGRPEEMVVVYDDIDLPWGRLRIRAKGGPGGHRGMESLVTELECENFPRLRVGIGGPPSGQPLEEFVLEEVRDSLWTEFESIVEQAAEAVRLLLEEGVGRAMNQVNPGPRDRTEPREARELNGGGCRHDG
ncbi:MAG: aminoacyl-tRNA hydrolase [Candidatus Eisenbacteria bacterium]|nr:aminoacyl-tRNA hydrolase [Candidatus Eisenbacteria bacterium]